MTDHEQLESLRAVSAKAELQVDGGVTCVLLPDVQLRTGAGTELLHAVLCPRGLGGYVTRLLLSRKVESKPTLNWQVVTLLGDAWHTWSWNNVAPTQPWLRIFAEHARVLR